MRLHTAKLAKFMGRHDSFILTTHDPADADGLGAELVFARILHEKGKKFRIINASAIPSHFRFMDPKGIVEQWDKKHSRLIKKSALILLDTADESTTGSMRESIPESKEIFVIDHHEPKSHTAFTGIADSSAASTSELAVMLAESLGVTLDPQTAFTAYIGIAYDTGFFAYSKTGPRTFRAALALHKLGVNPTEVYRRLNENASVEALLLQKRALAGMELHCSNKVAVQVLRLQDFAEAGAKQEETEGFVSFPLRAKDITVSLLLKEMPDGKVRCSLRSKGTVNVAKIAQELKGGGHTNAAGFTSEWDIDRTLEILMKKIAGLLKK